MFAALPVPDLQSMALLVSGIALLIAARRRPA
jgi:hypothetical protein